jgi:hypothetical protein
MGFRSGKFLTVVGILTIIYGGILCLFWASVLWERGAEWLQETWTAGQVLTTLLFALVPVILVGVGSVLCSSRSSSRLRVWAMAITALLLGAKVVLACHWALGNELEQQDSWFGIFASTVVFWGVMLFVVVPSGIWSLVLAGAAALSIGEPADVHGGGTGNENGFRFARQSRTRERLLLCGVLTLTLVGQVGGILLLGITRNQSPVFVTATELLTAYQHDAQKADAKYKGKWLLVKGKVADIRQMSTLAPGSSSVTVTLKGDRKDVSGMVTARVGFKLFGGPPGSTLEDFRKLTRGQEVTIRGKFSHKTEWDELVLEHPVIVD